MSNSFDNFINDLKVLFSQGNFSLRDNLVLASTTNTTLLAESLELKNKLNFNVLLDIVGTQYSSHEIELVYVFLSMKYGIRLLLSLKVSSEQKIPTLFCLYSNAKILEQELASKYLLTFEDLDHKIIDDQDLDLKSTIEFGPFFPFEISPMKISLEMNGEKISKCKISLGYLFKDFEERVKNFNHEQTRFMIEHLTQYSSFDLSFLYAYSIEKTLGINIPDRAKALRMLAAEIVRVMSNLRVLETMFDFAHYTYGSFAFKKIRNTLMDILEAWTLKRDDSLLNFNQIGGVTSDMPQGWPFKTMNVLRDIQKKLKEVTKTLDNASFWINLTSSDHLESSEALNLGVSGPTLKATGISYDLRKKSPYYYYNDLDFNIPLAAHGSTYDRYLIMVEEIYESLKIIFQLLDYIPSGICYEKIDLENIRLDKMTYCSIESFHGELGIFLDKNKKIKFRSTDLPLCYLLSEKSKGLTLEEFFMMALSFGVDTGQVDR